MSKWRKAQGCERIDDQTSINYFEACRTFLCPCGERIEADEYEPVKCAKCGREYKMGEPSLMTREVESDE